MPSIALIGPDGAGKTTLSRMLVETSALPLKHIYMGINIEASNHALPTSRLAEYLRHRRNIRTGEVLEAAFVQSETSKSGGKGPVRAMVRLAVHLTEEWYRQFLSWFYQARGYVVLYDRHFLFDFSLDGVRLREPSFEERLHRWFLTHLYPRPDLVIYLDAPGDVLFARKREKSVEELERRRQAFLQQQTRHASLIVLDATQPLSKVYGDVTECIRRSLSKEGTFEMANHGIEPR